MKFLSLLATAVLVSALGHCRAESWKEALLQNDLLAAMSWALFDMDPYSFLGQNNHTQVDNNEIQDSDSQGSHGIPSARSSPPSDEDEDYYYFDYGTQANGTQQNRQFINWNGLRPKLKVEIRMLKFKLLEIYDKSYIIMFLGTGAYGFIDDIFLLKGRNREDSFLYSLEDLVSLIGVDGPACVHRLLCELGAAPMFLTNGLFGELLDLTIRHILTSSYADVPSNSIDDLDYSSGRQASHDSSSSSNSSSSSSKSFHSSPEDEGRESSSPVSYLDAVAAGRHGANCAHTFDKCPISLLELTQFVHDQNL